MTAARNFRHAAAIALVIMGGSISAAAAQKGGSFTLTMSLLNPVPGSRCEIQMQILNMTAHTIDHMAIDISAQAAGHGTLASGTLSFRDVDSGRAGRAATQMNFACSNADYIQIRRIPVCRLDEQPRVGCFEALTPVSTAPINLAK